MYFGQAGAQQKRRATLVREKKVGGKGRWTGPRTGIQDLKPREPQLDVASRDKCETGGLAQSHV